MGRLGTLTGKEANTINFGLGPVGTMFKIGQRLWGMGLVWNSSTKVFDPKLKLGSQGTGIPTSTASPFAAEIHAKTNADDVLVAGDSGLSCGIRCRYEISKAQTNNISLVGVEGRLRVKAGIADGNHAGVMGTIEADAAMPFTGISTTQRSAGAFAIELGASCTFASTSGWLIGVSIDSSVHGTQTGMGNITFAGIRIKKSSGKMAWEYGITFDPADVKVGLYIPGGTASDTGTSGTAIQIGSFGTPVVLNTSGQKGIAAYFSSTETSGSLLGMRLRTRSNAASGTLGTVSLLVQADVLAGKFAQDCIAVNAECILKLGAEMAASGMFCAGQFKVEDEEATGTSGTNVTYGGYVSAIKLVSNISADPTSEHSMISMDAQAAGQGTPQALDSLIAIYAGGKNMDTLSLFHWLNASSIKTSGNYAVVLGDGACNQTAWTGSNEKGYVTLNIGGTYYQIPFFASS